MSFNTMENCLTQDEIQEIVTDYLESMLDDSDESWNVTLDTNSDWGFNDNE